MTNDLSDTTADSANQAAAASAEVHVLASDGPRRVNPADLDLGTLRGEIGANIEALREVQWALPSFYLGDGAATLSFDARARFAEMIRTMGETVRATLEAARTLFDLLPDPEAQSTPTPTGEDDQTLDRDAWRKIMSRPIERVADLVDKVMLLRAVSADSPEWSTALAQILLDLELLGRSAVANLPVYDDRAEGGELVELYRDWLTLRATDLSSDEAITEWSIAMAAVVDRIMLAPAWTAAGRRLKFEVLRTEIAPALSAPGSALDERLPMWLAALEVDATRKAA